MRSVALCVGPMLVLLGCAGRHAALEWQPLPEAPVQARPTLVDARGRIAQAFSAKTGGRLRFNVGASFALSCVEGQWVTPSVMLEPAAPASEYARTAEGWVVQLPVRPLSSTSRGYAGKIVDDGIGCLYRAGQDFAVPAFAASDDALRTTAAAWNALVERSRGVDDPNSQADFARRAEAWRVADPKPPLSEAGDRERVLAEHAFRSQDVEGAIGHYEAALDSDPTWPDGNYNLALLLGDGNPGWAVYYMKRYLALVPDGPDSRSAREKVIVWEDEAAHPKSHDESPVNEKAIPR